MNRSVTQITSQGPRSRRSLVVGRKVGCAESRWSLQIGTGGIVGAAWCPWRAIDGQLPPLVRYQQKLDRPGRVDAVGAWKRARRVSQTAGLVFNPREDVFSSPDPSLRAVAFEIVTDLLEMGVNVALTTRAGMTDAAPLVALARRFPHRLSLRVGLFGGPPDEERRWEAGLPSRGERLELIAALATTGAHVEVEVGPIIPFVSDDDIAWKSLFRAIGRAGVHQIVPRFIAGSPELVAQIEHEVAPSAGRMVLGWLGRGQDDPWLQALRGRRSGSAGPVPAADVVRALPLQAREPRLRRFVALANAANLKVRTCPCFDDGRAHVCHHLPTQVQTVEQLDLFADVSA